MKESLLSLSYDGWFQHDTFLKEYSATATNNAKC